MNIKITPFMEVFILKPKVNLDERGSFMESYNEKQIEKVLGRKISFCQDNQTFSKKGVLRGLHYQLPPFSQSKLVRVIEGKVLDIIVDIRKGSPTFGQHFSCKLSAENQLQIFIPRGFAHGYITLSETSIFSYKVDNFYNKESEESIAYDDPNLGIDWILDPSTFLISEKDKLHPNLDQAQWFDFKKPLYD
jgi:dTDP-4-dehydrorhamnose 3,5-epimerase